jgi:hypothetical protein
MKTLANIPVINCTLCSKCIALGVYLFLLWILNFTFAGYNRAVHRIKHAVITKARKHEFFVSFLPVVNFMVI